MQEQITFKLSEGFLKNHSGLVELKRELLLNIKAIEALLVSYHFRSRGRVFNVTLNEDTAELLKADMARFRVSYTVGLFNACADVDYTEGATMEMLIDLDFDRATAIITGEYIPERDPDEL